MGANGKSALALAAASETLAAETKVASVAVAADIEEASEPVAAALAANMRADMHADTYRRMGAHRDGGSARDSAGRQASSGGGMTEAMGDDVTDADTDTGAVADADDSDADGDEDVDVDLDADSDIATIDTSDAGTDAPCDPCELA